MAINLAKKYEKKVDEKWSSEELTGSMGGADYDFNGVNEVVIYKVDDAEMHDYTRSGSNRYGTPEELGDSIETKKMRRDRSFTFTIDRGNRNDQMMVKEAGKRLARQIKNVATPERDTYNIGIGVSRASVKGYVVSTTLTTTNSYEKFCEVMEKMDDALVPVKGRLCYAKPSAYNLLKRCSEFTKMIDAGKKFTINGQVGDIDEVAIIKVPSRYFPKNVNMLFVHPQAIGTPKKLADYKIHDNPPGINGWLVEGRLIYDCYMLDNKEKGAFVLSEGAIGFDSKSVAGTASGDTKLSYTLPGDLSETDDSLTVKYKLASSAITLPDYGATVSGYTEYTESDIAASTNTKYALVVLKDSKVILATGGDLVKHA